MSASAADRRLIVVEGLPGSGHTEFARWIGSQEDWYAACVNHHVETRGQRLSSLSPLLQRLLERFEAMQQLAGADLFRKRVVTDYTFETHLLWARALLPERDWLLYRKIAGVIAAPAVQPDLVVYLQAPESGLVPELRALDKTVDLDRWRELITAYNHHFFEYEQAPLLVVRTASSDWLDRDAARAALWQQVQSFQGGKTYLLGQSDFWEGGHPAGG
ncbi:MAG: deoxynucleoside kinase [candidate division Zixibacteria bacterium]|nr:deoxynucleoside kinase [candidate division Zixibacteria bacterium]